LIEAGDWEPHGGSNLKSRLRARIKPGLPNGAAIMWSGACFQNKMQSDSIFVSA